MSLKDKIQSNFAGQLAISELHAIESKIVPMLISDEKAVKKYYKFVSGKELDLDNPKTFSEKLNWYKLNDRNPLMVQCADKVAVRDYVAKCGYKDSLNEIYGVYKKVSEINLDNLPNHFVLKASHGSHMNIIVKDKSQINWHKARMMMRSWLHQDIAWSGREWCYRYVPKRIIAEKYLEDESGELRDYKFFCFNGQPMCLQLELGRFKDNNIRNFYDVNWELLPFGKGIPHNSNVHVNKPKKFKYMLQMAKEFSKLFQFVRVDLYQVDNKVYFGELTFFPAGGAANFIPSKWDVVVGSWWKLEHKHSISRERERE